jgi:prevent-host-death family protein
MSYSRLVTRVIAQRELRNDNAKVLNAVCAGQTFIITRNGEPVAELRPVRPGRRRVVPRADLLIAATAHAHDLPLYTRNGADFQGLDQLVTVHEI